MKLLRYGKPGHEKPGLLDESGAVRDLSSVIDDVAGAALSNKSIDSLRTFNPNDLPLVKGKPQEDLRLGACVGDVAGFCVINDVSEREFQIERSGTWDKGKGCDTFGPTGPWLVTQDEVGNVDNLNIWCEVDGKRFQNGSTSTMVFKVPHLVSYWW